ncbi:MAG TPA: polysaccharide biosynthesis C-terminal domain-containing protein [Vicinamibacterales bacterium]|nr:polysaccharide biosynthesis C-terminal domain-containing protein [Vicinamibacterales bacterium]
MRAPRRRSVRHDLMQQDVRVFAALAAGKAMVAGSALAAALIVGRMVGAEDFGRWSLIIAAATFLHTAFVNWTHAATVRFGHDEWVRSGTIARTLSARVPILLLSLAAPALLVALSPAVWLERIFGVGREALALIGLQAAALWIAAEAQATLQAIGRIDRQATVAPIVALTGIAGLLALAWAESGTVTSAIVTVASSASIIWGAAWFWALAAGRARITAAPLPDIKRQFLYSAPLLLAFGVGYLSDWGDHLLLQQQLSLAIVGEFALAYQIFVSIVAANGVVSTVALPRLIAGQARGADAAARYMRQVVPTILVVWMIATTALVAVLPAALAFVAGAQFAGSAETLRVLCIVLPTSIITSLMSVLLSLQERLERVLIYTALMTAVNLTLSVVLIPRVGVLGAAIGTAASYVVAQAVYLRDQRRHLAIRNPGMTGIWCVGLLFGVLQSAIASLPLRVLWAAMATFALVLMTRHYRAIDGVTVDRMLGGAWPPLRTALHKALVR